MKDLNKVIKDLGKELLNKIDLPQTSKYVLNFVGKDKTHAGREGDIILFNRGEVNFEKRPYGSSSFAKNETTYFTWDIDTRNVSQKELEVIIKELFEAKTRDILDASEFFESLYYEKSGTQHPIMDGRHYVINDDEKEIVSVYFSLIGIPKV